MRTVIAAVAAVAAMLLAVLLPAVSVRADVIVDDADAATSATGTWCASTFGGWNGGSKYSCGAGVGAVDTFTWRLPTALGTFDVAITWAANANRGRAVPVAVTDGVTTTTLTLDMTVPPPNGWAQLGAYVNPTRVTVSSQWPGPGGEASADAVRVAPRTTATVTPVPVMTISATSAALETPRAYTFRAAYSGVDAANRAEALVDHVVAPNQADQVACAAGAVGGARCVQFDALLLAMQPRAVTLQAVDPTGARSAESSGMLIAASIPSAPSAVASATAVRTAVPATRTVTAIATPPPVPTATPHPSTTAMPTSTGTVAPSVLTQVILLSSTGAVRRFAAASPAPGASPLPPLLLSVPTSITVTAPDGGRTFVPAP